MTSKSTFGTPQVGTRKARWTFIKYRCPQNEFPNGVINTLLPDSRCSTFF